MRTQLDRVERFGGGAEELRPRVDALEKRLRNVQALTARAYEAQLNWPERLAALRASQGYEDAFTGEPLVSVRIATYNNAEELCERALASVRRQSYDRWEAVVVGDACDDDTGARIAALGDPRIRFWNLPYRGPYPDDPEELWLVAGARPVNAATDATVGLWIAGLDDDDEWDDDHIETLLGAAQEHHAELAYGRLRVAIEGAEGEGELCAWPPRLGEFVFQAALYHGYLREFRYDMNCYLAGEPDDWNLARRMWEAGVRFTFVDRFVGTYFVGPDHRHREEWLRRASEPLPEDS